MDLKYWYDEDFSKFKEAHKNDNPQDMKLAGLNGFKYYLSSYKAEVVALPLKDNNYALELYIYTEKETEAEVMKIFNSDAVQSILKTVKITNK